jgi:hypothetical protein
VLQPLNEPRATERGVSGCNAPFSSAVRRDSPEADVVGECGGADRARTDDDQIKSKAIMRSRVPI